MNAIVRIESDIVSEFNNYLQREAPTVSFLQDSTGYFRLSSEFPSSAGISEFGTFLQSSGYNIRSISTASTKDGREGTAVSFSKDGQEYVAVLSTIRIY